MKHVQGIPVWGEHDQQSVDQMANAAAHDAVVATALMADHHLGYSVPIGGVIAYEGHVSPSAVGYDIACGNKAVRLDVDPSYVLNNIAAIMDEIWRTIVFGVGGENPERADHPVLDSPDFTLFPLLGTLKDLAARQLGTIGSGNHYVDVFLDDLQRIWVGVHFGSRGLGHKIASHFIAEGGGSDGMFVSPVVFDVEGDLGAQYLIGMHLAGEYAYAGRDWVCDRVAKIIGSEIVEEVHNNHNFAWYERLELQPDKKTNCVVVRKGATPARDGESGFVGGSMGEKSVILRGRHEDPAEALAGLYSTVHGAGRVMGRRKAAGKWKYNKATGEHRQVAPGLVTQEMMDKWLEGIELRGGGLDESPDCYKRLDAVLKSHRSTIEVLHTLSPLGVAMAGKGR